MSTLDKLIDEIYELDQLLKQNVERRTNLEKERSDLIDQNNKMSLRMSALQDVLITHAKTKEDILVLRLSYKEKGDIQYGMSQIGINQIASGIFSNNIIQQYQNVQGQMQQNTLGAYYPQQIIKV